MKNTKDDKDIIEKQKKVREQLIKKYIEYRKRRNLTQEELADAMGITRPNISRFEIGQCNPTLDLLVKMAESLDLEIKIDLVNKEDVVEDE